MLAFEGSYKISRTNDVHIASEVGKIFFFFLENGNRKPSSNWKPSYITYIIGHYNPSVRIIDLVSHTTYVVCVNFIHKWRDLQFKVDSERQIFWETFHGKLKTFLQWKCLSSTNNICEHVYTRVAFYISVLENKNKY